MSVLTEYRFPAKRVGRRHQSWRILFLIFFEHWWARRWKRFDAMRFCTYLWVLICVWRYDKEILMKWSLEWRSLRMGKNPLPCPELVCFWAYHNRSAMFWDDDGKHGGCRWGGGRDSANMYPLRPGYHLPLKHTARYRLHGLLTFSFPIYQFIAICLRFPRLLSSLFENAICCGLAGMREWMTITI